MKTKIINIFKWIGLGFLEPVIRLISGDDVRKNTISIFKKIVFPVLAILLFVVAWSSFSDSLQNTAIQNKYDKEVVKQGKEVADDLLVAMKDPTSAERPKTLPTPSDVLKAYRSLRSEHKRISGVKKKQIASKEKNNDKKIAKWMKVTTPQTMENSSGEKVEVIPAELAKSFKKTRGKSFFGGEDYSPLGFLKEEYSGPPTFFDQVKTSLFNVFCGFLLAMFIAVPLGIVMGLSDTVRDAINPFIQVFKPVSPVVWYLLVYMIVTTLMPDGGTESNTTFYITFIAVGLCSMWATLVNTAVGVSSVDKDILNVSKVLKLGTFQHVFKVILPASIPMIFTGLRITMSVSWMVLIAIELLSSSPGLGTFVWEEYQGDALDSNAKIIFAMLVIGFIGFLLDRIMTMLQNLVSFEDDTLS